MMMMMMMMRCLSWLRFRAKPRHLPYIYIYTYKRVFFAVEIHRLWEALTLKNSSGMQLCTTCDDESATLACCLIYG